MSLFSKTHWLNELYKEGKLKRVMRKFRNDINENHVLGYGTQVYCFGTKKDRKVLKLVPKKIRFYNEPSFKTFKDEINDLEPFFIPVIKIIYEDENIFIYSQHICHKIKKDADKNPYIVMSILLLVIIMLLKNRIVTDIGPHNIGVYHRNIGIFDCHGLQKIDLTINWYSRLLINLNRYLNHFNNTCNLTEIFESNDINKIVEKLSRDIFDPIYRNHYNLLSDKKKYIINKKLSIITSIA